MLSQLFLSLLVNYFLKNEVDPNSPYLSINIWKIWLTGYDYVVFEEKKGKPWVEMRRAFAFNGKFIIPTLMEETDKIMSAQKARGADFETGSLMDRARALLPILVPLFVSAFRRADELAIAMESRCYNGGAGRTRMKQLRFKGGDYGALLFGVLLIVGMIGLQVIGL